jgi:hypothetical protein
MTLSLASGAGAHFSFPCDAVRASAAMDFPYPLLPLAGTIETITVPRFSFVEAFLLRLGEGGNTRCAGSAIRSAHDIPACGEFGRPWH